MRAEDASSAFLLWICSASHADFTAIEPGKCDTAGPYLLWVWPHARQCLLVTPSSDAVLGAEAALWPCTVLAAPALSHANLPRASMGGLKASPGSQSAVPGESPQSTSCSSDQSLDCLLLNDRGWWVFWFRPVRVGSLPGVWVSVVRAHLQQLGATVRVLLIMHLHQSPTPCSSFTTSCYLTTSLSPGVPSWAFSELDGQFQLSRDLHNEFMASTSAVVLLTSVSAYSGYPVTKLSKVLLGREFCFLHV